jgi:hypothetical protein
MEVKYVIPSEESTNIAKLEPNLPADIGMYQESNDENSEQHGQPLQELSRTTVHENQVCYINGKYHICQYLISSALSIKVSCFPPFL